MYFLFRLLCKVRGHIWIKQDKVVANCLLIRVDGTTTLCQVDADLRRCRRCREHSILLFPGGETDAEFDGIGVTVEKVGE